MSVLFHLTVLILLAFVQASPARLQENKNQQLTARVAAIKRIVQASPTAPKPKIQKIAGSRPQTILGQTFTAGSAFFPRKAGSVDINDKQILKPAQTVLPALSGSGLQQQAVFFGSRTDRRWICYLVDCSGSMSGMFGWVRQQLKDSIARLQQDHYFRIIFFGNDKIFEFGEGSFLRASVKNKSAAYDYIDSVRTAGGADALAALTKAIQSPDSLAAGQVIYFLTDGFELVGENSSFEEQITDLLKSDASAVQINTIGFWPGEQDRVMLEKIALNSGGEFTLITDDDRLQDSNNQK
jgi:hypothetical protein